MQTEWASGDGRDKPTGGFAGHGRREPKVVVGAAIIVAGRVLACARSSPPETAGRWEFPGGKVEPGETEVAALIRECAEELGVRVEIGDRIGRDVRMGHGRSVLKVYSARLVGEDQPQPLEHSELRWLRPEELDSVPWLPADVPVVAALRPLLAAADPS
ncbi:(deoxy)nucleoside triphosphate pyrophosphohydrolase [Plantactinospora sp. S1510]|uniref:8-oxo-dGTP diphosphatase n=1 Tax=Plantactinospora alkalitolerans TaxID=2789879 RepID=A0ABS0GW11_9ACTN|nr:(deoxy)nucleoside triphosphate pyrophosphohydrolase [Plantactinospora alkalitolerans]